MMCMANACGLRQRYLEIKLVVTGRSVEISRLVQIGKGDDTSKKISLARGTRKTLKTPSIHSKGGSCPRTENIFRCGTRKTQKTPSLTYRGQSFLSARKNKFRCDWNFVPGLPSIEDVGDWLSLTSLRRSPARSVLGAAPFQSLSDDQLNNFENLH